MNTRFKVLTGAVVGLLVGIGMCGINALLPSSKGQEFGGGAAFIGFAICCLSVLLLFVTVLYIVIGSIIGSFRNKE